MHVDRVERLFCVESPSGWAHRRNVSSAADCLLLRLPSVRARSLGLRSIGEGTRRLTGDGPSTEAAEEATGGKGSRPMTNKFLITNYNIQRATVPAAT